MIYATLLALTLQVPPLADSLLPPPVTRELRAVWVATVNNIDWPSRPDLPTGEQQEEMLAILNRAARLRLNAIVLQVRPVADALYASTYEPWSKYLTGRQGRRPEPYWDPLAFAVTEAHKRGLELHAWFNPYRAAFGRESLPASNHVSQRQSRYVVQYGRYLWMDPGYPAVRRLMVRTVMDVVRRYDIDGVHIDDYFYPYPENDANGQKIDFPDSETYAAYRREGGQLDRADWRRNNVNVLVREFYSAVKAEKAWVKVGISPFGIWRPANPPTIQAGIDQYDELFADARKWLNEGTLDYIAPQLYWAIDPPEQSFPVLLQWWVEQSLKGRHVWPGLGAHRLAQTGPRGFRSTEITRQIQITRETRGATGHITFNAKILMQNVDSIADRLAELYAEPALVPASPWLDRVPPARPTVRIVADSLSGEPVAHIAPGDQQVVRHWVVQTRVDGSWRTTLLPGPQRRHILKNEESAAELVIVSAVDRTGNLSRAAIVRRSR
jgi:uncharacterized lipoprotein YddW (UPF0748 family)